MNRLRDRDRPWGLVGRQEFAVVVRVGVLCRAKSLITRRIHRLRAGCSNELRVLFQQRLYLVRGGVLLHFLESLADSLSKACSSKSLLGEVVLVSIKEDDRTLRWRLLMVNASHNCRSG